MAAQGHHQSGQVQRGGGQPLIQEAGQIARRGPGTDPAVTTGHGSDEAAQARRRSRILVGRGHPFRRYRHHVLDRQHLGWPGLLSQGRAGNADRAELLNSPALRAHAKNLGKPYFLVRDRSPARA
jgi:hypothetical protein